MTVERADADNPDTPTVTFGAFDGSGRPGVIYDMLWGLPRVDAPSSSDRSASAGSAR
jgi:hypothetical protein